MRKQPVRLSATETNTLHVVAALDLAAPGLTFGTISALYGLTHEIVTQEQYSFLVAAVIASAVIPTMIANAVFLPRHLLPGPPVADEDIAPLETAPAGEEMDASNGLADE